MVVLRKIKCFNLLSMSRIRLKDIFEKEPFQWGLRGDPFLWQEIKDSIESETKLDTQEDFTNFLNKCFEKVTGYNIEKGKNFYVEKYNLGGMSSGMVSSDFWIEEGFPLLTQRFNPILL